MIAVAAPLVAFFLFYCIARGRQLEFAAAILIAATAWGVVLAGLTELLSAFHWLTYLGILTAWCIVDFVALIACMRAGAIAFPKTCALPRCLLFCIAALVIATGFTGLFSAPTNWDSMTYHLSRVMHWMHNRTVADYPTNCVRQLYQAPWAEFAMLHFQALADGDRFAFGVQWVSLCIVLIGVAEIARLIGADSRGQIIAVTFAATLPATLLQAESTQNNLVLSAWLIAAIYFLLRFGDSDRKHRIAWAIAFGSAIGLAVLTKGTAYPLGFPLIAWFAVLAVRRGGRGGTGAILAAAIVVLLNLGHTIRNMHQFDSPLMPAYELATYRASGISPGLLTSNLLRNLGLQLATPDQRVNGWLQDAIEAMHRCIGVDINDPRITVPGPEFDVQPYPMINEDFVSNPLHLILILIAIVWAISTAPRPARILLAMAIGGFVLFCATLKWQAYNTRLHLPIFILAAAPVGLMLSSARIRTVSAATCALLVGLTVPYLLQNPSHPWIGKHSIFINSREQEYFLNNANLPESYLPACDFLAQNHYDSIGLLAGNDDWEYPLWVLLRDRLGHWPDIQDTPQTNIQWPDVSAVLVTQPDLLHALESVDPYWQWEAHTFGRVTVLVNVRALARRESFSDRRVSLQAGSGCALPGSAAAAVRYCSAAR
jgi:Dolichyl-phosphate-mannose-protein mannosyltransferase